MSEVRLPATPEGEQIVGTRADFYVGRGPDAEWIGSTAYDGYPSDETCTVGVEEAILNANTEQDFRAAVAARLASRDDATTPEQGWPWPWEDSSETDYAYAFDEGQTWVSHFGAPWYRAQDGSQYAVFPPMTERKNVAVGPRSGMMVLRVPGGAY